ncbi:MAG: ATP-binding cassette domain-containing protein, partial [Betaproteobacteria bacterium]
MIKFSALNKWFGANHVLQDINLHVAPGEVVVVCGPSGSGKSTLIRCVNGLEQFQNGSLVVDGTSISDASQLRRLRMELGFVFQQFNLYPHMSALDNVALAPIHVRRMSRADALARSRAQLERVGLGDKFDALPNQLSGG